MFTIFHKHDDIIKTENLTDGSSRMYVECMTCLRRTDGVILDNSHYVRKHIGNAA